MDREIIIEEKDRKEDAELFQLLRELVRGQQHEIHILKRLLRPFENYHEYELKLTLYPVGGDSMSTLPITSIPLGGQAQLVAQLTQNGLPYVPPAGSTFTFSPTVVSADPNVTSAPATADVTGGAVPLNQQFLLSDAAGDVVGAVDAVTVSGTAPDGTPVTDTINITVGPSTAPSSFGLSLALYPAPAAAGAVRK